MVRDIKGLVDCSFNFSFNIFMIVLNVTLIKYYFLFYEIINLQLDMNNCQLSCKC